MTSSVNQTPGARRFGLTRETQIDVLIGVALFLVTIILLSQTSLSLGFTRDEGYYFKAGELYFGWFRELYQDWSQGNWWRPFQQDVIDKHWKYNHEHPVLVKAAFALSWGVLKEQWGLFDLHSSAFRFPAWVFAGFSVALVFALGRALLPRRAALLAALMWLSMPRVFWHMHLACFDIPVCAAHLWLVYAYYKGRWSLKGGLLIGIAFGLAISVKHNVLVTPAFFVLHWLVMEARGFKRTKSSFQVPAIPASFFFLAIVGPIVFVAHWPYVWSKTIERIGWYLGFHLKHEHYPILWFKDLLTAPPFPISFPFVMSAVTIPAPLLVVFSMGLLWAVYAAGRTIVHRIMGTDEPGDQRVPLGDTSKEPTGSVAFLLLLNIAFPFLLIALPSSPIFGGTKHWMNALPFLCILGAWVLEDAFCRLKVLGQAYGANLKKRTIQIVTLFIFVGVLIPGIAISARVHPFGLASYNSVVGFARGAANTGFQRTFWGYEPRQELPFVNETMPKNGRIHFGDTNLDDYKMYRRDGLLRKDIRYSGNVSNAQMASVQPQGEFKAQWMKVLNNWQVNGPDVVVHIEGVPLVTITKKP